MQKVQQRLAVILKKAKSSGVRFDTLGSNEVVRLCTRKSKSKIRKICRYVYCFATILLIIYGTSYVNFNSKCLIDMPIDSSKVFREAEDCKMCEGVTHVDKVKNISPEEFEEYVVKVKPVVVTDGTRDWSAPRTFNFEFFKRIYLHGNDAEERKTCQFFPYKTEFQSLEEVFNMSEARSRLEPGTLPWYIGWSNCNDKARKELKKHYKRPYFLPETSENIALNWIFMGGPGAGAHMHVDNVQYPSWQAQLRGRKTWRLAPPPECLYSCNEMKVTVERGEIIVVDTNRWYHQTHILPGEISVTIGAEFD